MMPSLLATRSQVWWPSTSEVRFDGAHLPVWDEITAAYLDPDTGNQAVTRVYVQEDTDDGNAQAA
jgi:hypothetical protein